MLTFSCWLLHRSLLGFCRNLNVVAGPLDSTSPARPCCENDPAASVARRNSATAGCCTVCGNEAPRFSTTCKIGSPIWLLSGSDLLVPSPGLNTLPTAPESYYTGSARANQSARVLPPDLCGDPPSPASSDLGVYSDESEAVKTLYRLLEIPKTEQNNGIYRLRGPLAMRPRSWSRISGPASCGCWTGSAKPRAVASLATGVG